MKPILFNIDMVRAILEGRKTVTRRVIGRDIINNCDIEADGTLLNYQNCHGDFINPVELCRYKVNDVLYVRETWIDWSCEECDCECVPDNGSGGCVMPAYLYAASDERPDKGWKPSIHMPKEAARIFLKVTDIRLERLQDITEDGVWNEGFRFKPPCLTRVSADGHCCDLDGPCTSSIKYCDMTMGELFGRELWNSTIKKADIEQYGWDANPYVWVIEFKKITKDEAYKGEKN